MKYKKVLKERKEAGDQYPGFQIFITRRVAETCLLTFKLLVTDMLHPPACALAVVVPIG